MATIVLGIAGAAIGSIYGPAGMKLGWAIGTTLGGIFEYMNQPTITQTVGALDDLKISGSSYGASIPRLWGKVMLPGQIIWAARDGDGNHLIRHSEFTSSGGGGSAGGGGSETETVWYTCTYAVKFGVGTYMNPDGTFVYRNPVFKKIWCDDILVWEEGGTNNIVTIRTYTGTETQTVDPIIESSEGVGNAPAYRGDIYAVFESQSLRDHSNRIPNIRAEIHTDEVSTGDVYEDICRAADLQLEDIDRTLATANVTGMVQLNKSESKGLIEVLRSAYMCDMAQYGDGLALVPRGQAVTVSVTEDEIGIKESGLEYVSTLEKEMKDLTELPGKVTVKFYNLNSQYETDSQSDVRHSVEIANDVTLNFPLTLSSTEGRAIASAYLDFLWIESTMYSFSLGMKYIWLAPSDVINVTYKGLTYRMRIVEMDLGDPGEIKCKAVLDDDEIIDQHLAGGTAIAPVSDPLTVVDTDFVVWSGTELRDQDQRACGFYVAANGPSGWKGATIYYSTDGGGSWVKGGTVLGKATFGETLGALADGTTPREWDETNSVQVSLLYGELATTVRDSVLGGYNVAMIGGEICGFSVADLIATDEYELSDLYRGIRDSEMTGHLTGEKFVLVNSSTVRVEVAEEYAGSTLLVKCVSSGQDIADAVSQSVVISAKTPSVVDTLVENVLIPVEITPVVIASGIGASSGYDTYDISAHTPSTAQRGIFQLVASDNTTGSHGEIFYKKSSSGFESIVLEFGPFGDDYKVMSEFSRDLENAGARTFQLSVSTLYFVTWELRLIGYWKTV